MKTCIRSKKTFTRLFIAVLFSIWGLGGLFAQDTIKLTWQVNKPTNTKHLCFALEHTFSYAVIDWGDDIIDTVTPTLVGGCNNVWHTYVDSGNYTVTFIAPDTNNRCCIFSSNGQNIMSINPIRCPELAVIECSSNSYWGHTQLTVLDLSNCPKLQGLHCDGGQLTALDLSKCPELLALFCNDNQLTTLDLSKCPELQYLCCENNQLTTLNVNGCSKLWHLECFNNCLPLSELYKISQMGPPWSFPLGTQRLLRQQILVGNSINYSSQTEFGGIPTVFNVEKNGIPAVLNTDYTIYDGIILFNTAGKYLIIMTNAAISSDPFWPAEVIAEINVVELNTDATLSFLGTSHGKLTPVFDSTIVNYFTYITGFIGEFCITAIPTDPNAKVSGNVGWQKLEDGKNIFIITVTAEDKTTTKNYYINVNYNVGIATINNEQLAINYYEVFDITGKKVFTSPTPSKGGEHSIPFGEGWGGMLPKGIYIIKLNTNKGIIIKKIINQ